MLIHLPGPRLLILILLTALALRLYDLATSQPQDLPWTPLSLSDPIGPFTVLKLGALRDNPSNCYALLKDVDVAISPCRLSTAPARVATPTACSLATMAAASLTGLLWRQPVRSRGRYSSGGTR